MAGRASIVGAAATHVGNVRQHNEDAHHMDAAKGLFIVCDGMGGHAAGEVASALAVESIRAHWDQETTRSLVDAWLKTGKPDLRRRVIAALRQGVEAAHAAIITEASTDLKKSGMGTTVVGGLIVGSELLIAHCGDSRAYLIRNGSAHQLTEDHTLLARLLAAGIDVDVAGEGGRFRSMLTNALGISHECRVSTLAVELADGDRFLLCTDGVTEYVKEEEISSLLTKEQTPDQVSAKLIELSLERGGADNATVVVFQVVKADDTASHPPERAESDELAIAQSPLWSAKITPQQRLRAMRIAIPRRLAKGEHIAPQVLGERTTWILLEGKLLQRGALMGPGSVIYPECLIAGSQLPGRDGYAVARTEARVVALRAVDFNDLCDEDPDLGAVLQDGLVILQTVVADPEPEPLPDLVGDPAESFGDDKTQLEFDAKGLPNRASSSPPEIEVTIEHTLRSNSAEARVGSEGESESNRDTQANPIAGPEQWIDPATGAPLARMAGKPRSPRLDSTAETLAEQIEEENDIEAPNASQKAKSTTADLDGEDPEVVIRHGSRPDLDHGKTTQMAPLTDEEIAAMEGEQRAKVATADGGLRRTKLGTGSEPSVIVSDSLGGSVSTGEGQRAVGNELDDRFDAMASPALAKEQRSASDPTVRVPLVLGQPRTTTANSLAAIAAPRPSVRSIPQPSQIPSEPEIRIEQGDDGNPDPTDFVAIDWDAQATETSSNVLHLDDVAGHAHHDEEPTAIVSLDSPHAKPSPGPVKIRRDFD